MVQGRLQSATGLVAELKAKEHEFVSGVAPKLGGGDEGPDPHELLEAALAACTILTVQMYARRKEIALAAVDVRVKIVAEGETTEISRSISFRGELSPEQRERLLTIAEKCPIHRILSRPISVKTELID